MLTVSCTECIHYIAVSVRSKSLCKFLLLSLHLFLSSLVCRILLVDTYWLTLFLWVVTKVLEKKNLTSLQSSSSLLSLCAVWSELNLSYTKSSSNCVLDLSERKLWLYLTLWLTHVRHDDESTTLLKDQLKCWKSTTDTSVVCDLTILQRYIEIYTYDCLLTGKVVIVNLHNSF